MSWIHPLHAAEERIDDARKALNFATGSKSRSLEEAVDAAIEAMSNLPFEADPAKVDWADMARRADKLGIEGTATILARAFGLEVADVRARLAVAYQQPGAVLEFRRRDGPG